MTIKILPPQLANQIAAGEVVERPASVVKELVENALDAGASKIEIEVDKGGHKRILIRDNGKGIEKEQLALALSRHATSKISDIDDLEAIVSLGFRGEALASISSVSRLTMTSKPAEQNEAWSAMAEGLDMSVKVLPAAHPNGTSVEVLDLFFNTPARRKFLRAEKTEFTHIETLIKRIALSRPDVEFVLKHNAKIVKRFRRQNDSDKVQQQTNRIAEVINKGFIESTSAVSCQYDQIRISVWVKSPNLCSSVNPAQYSFVNGRMMRDKLILHGVRQAYGELLHSEQSPEYVLFIDLPADQVDVNVHPAKHEVRFHHARLLHDLLLKTIQEALAEFNQAPSLLEPENKPEWIAEHKTAYQQAGSVSQITKNELKLDGSTKNSEPSLIFSGLKSAGSELHSKNVEMPSLQNKNSYNQNANFQKPPISKQQFDVFAQYATASSQIDKPTEALTAHVAPDQHSPIFVMIEDQQYVYFIYQNSMWLLDSHVLAKKQPSTLNIEQLSTTPLLVPIRLKLTKDEKNWCELNTELLRSHGFELKIHQQFLIIKQVPAFLRSSNSGQTLPALFNQLMTIEALTTEQLNQQISNAKVQPIECNDWQSKLLQLAQQQILTQIASKLDPKQQLK